MNDQIKPTYVACFNCTGIGRIEYFTALSDGQVTIYYCDNCRDEFEKVVTDFEKAFPELGGLDDDDIPF